MTGELNNRDIKMNIASWNVRKPKQKNLKAFASIIFFLKKGDSNWHETFLELLEILKWLYINIMNL